MNEYIWQDLYLDAVQRFGGETPSRTTEAAVIEIFEQRPEHVRAAIDKLAARFADGKIRSPWALILDELNDQADRNVVADAKQERARAIHLAERWIVNAGLQAPLDEALDELFGHRGRLEPWAGDVELRARMVALWEAEQPRMVALEAEQQARWARQAAAYHARFCATCGQKLDGHGQCPKGHSPALERGLVTGALLTVEPVEVTP